MNAMKENNEAELTDLFYTAFSDNLCCPTATLTPFQI